MTKALLILPNHPSYYPHVERHARTLRKRYDQVDVLAIFAPGDLLPALDGVSYYPLAQKHAKGILGFLALMWRVVRFLSQGGWAVIEAIDPPCLIPAAWALRKKNIRLVYFSMEVFPETPALAQKPLRRWIWKKLEAWAAQRADFVFTVNESVAFVLEQNLGREPIGVVRSMPLQQNPRKGTGELRRLCGVAPGDFLLVYQGHLEAGRGLDFAADCLQQRPDVHLAILGFGPWETWAIERAQVQSNIHYCGAHPFGRLMDLAADADAGLVWIEPVSTSYRLSLPGKLFEYAHNQLPMLGSPLPEIERHILEYGLGEVGSDFQEESFLQALDRLIFGVRAQCYLSMLERARQELCWEREQDALLRAFP